MYNSNQCQKATNSKLRYNYMNLPHKSYTFWLVRFGSRLVAQNLILQIKSNNANKK